MDAVSGIGNKYVPSRVYGVSFLKTCSTRVVATWPLIFVSSWIDLTGKTLGIGTGRGIGRGRQGLRSQMIGTITPCALTCDEQKNTILDNATTAKANTLIFIRFS